MANEIESIDNFEKSESMIKLKPKDTNLNETNFLNLSNDFIETFGFSNLSSYIDLKYEYFKINFDKRPYLCVQVELPAESKITACRAKMFRHFWYIIIKGKKTLERHQNKDIQDLFSIREEGDLFLKIRLSSEEFQFLENRPDKTKTANNNGIISYYFPLVYFNEEEESEDS